MISATNLGKSFGERALFSDVSFRLNPGERYGLVGANGSGKTTLINILSGDVEPSEGSVSLPKRIRLGVLRQDQFLYETEEIIGVTLMGNPELWAAMAEKERLLAKAEEDFEGNEEPGVRERKKLRAESDPQKLAALIRGLGTITDAKTAETVIDLFKKNSELVRETAVVTLLKIDEGQ